MLNPMIYFEHLVRAIYDRMGKGLIDKKDMLWPPSSARPSFF